MKSFAQKKENPTKTGRANCRVMDGRLEKIQRKLKLSLAGKGKK